MQPMTIKMIPGPRDEEKIAIIQNARMTLSEEDYWDFVYEHCYSDEKTLGLMHCITQVGTVMPL